MRQDGESNLVGSAGRSVAAGRRWPPGPGNRTRLVLASALMLFIELALIRWTSSNNLYLVHLTNFVLLASFLGIGVGFLRGRAVIRAGRCGGPARICQLRRRECIQAPSCAQRCLIDVRKVQQSEAMIANVCNFNREVRAELVLNAEVVIHDVR